jgi:Family of unknown function (DUF5677)
LRGDFAAGYVSLYRPARCWMLVMGTLEEKYLEGLRHLLFSDLLDQKLRAQGIKLSNHKLSELTGKILEEPLQSIDFDDGRKCGRERKIVIELTDADSQRLAKRFEEYIDPVSIEKFARKISETTLATLKRRWPNESRAQRRDLDAFRRRLDKRWSDGFQKLQMLLTIAREYGSELSDAIAATGGGASPRAFKILIKLHARSCQVAEEILCLLRNGFADGAIARWRTFHEIVAVGDLTHLIHGSAFEGWRV